MTIQEFLRAIRHGWKWIALTTFLGVCLGVAAAKLLPANYSATATDFVSVAPESSQGAYEASQFVNSRVPSYPELVKAPDVLEAAITDADSTLTLKKAREAVTATNPTDSSLVTVTVKDRSAVAAEKLANSVAEQLALKIMETDGAGKAGIKVELVVPAVQPTAPTFPNLPVMIMLGLVSGLALGVVIAILRAFRAGKASGASTNP